MYPCCMRPQSMSVQLWQYVGLWKVFLLKLCPWLAGVSAETDAMFPDPPRHRSRQILTVKLRGARRASTYYITCQPLRDLETVREHCVAGVVAARGPYPCPYPCLLRQRSLFLHAWGAFPDEEIALSNTPRSGSLRPLTAAFYGYYPPPHSWWAYHSRNWWNYTIGAPYAHPRHEPSAEALLYGLGKTL